MIHKYLVAVVLTLLMLPISAQADKTVNKPTQQVAVITVSEQAALVRQLLGTVFAPQTQTLSSQVAGIVTSRHLSMGHSISKGDVIVQLDVREAKAELELAQAEMEIAKIRLKQQQLAFNRINKTYSKKLISRASYDEIDLQLQQAISELSAFKAKYQIAKLNLEKHSIRAPFNGLLITASPVVGKQLLPGENVVDMLNSQHLKIKAELSQQELANLKKGLVQMVWKKQQSFPLKLLASSPTSIHRSGALAAEFSLPVNTNDDINDRSLANANSDSLHSGQILILQIIEKHLSVPDHAIVEDQQGRYVLAVSEGKSTRVAITDLKPGQQVIVLASDSLLAGDDVSILLLDKAPLDET